MSSLGDLRGDLRAHLTALRTQKQTSGVIWDIERHERWLRELDALAGPPIASIALNTPLAKLEVAAKLIREAAFKTRSLQSPKAAGPILPESQSAICHCRRDQSSHLGTGSRRQLQNGPSNRSSMVQQ